MNTIDLPQCRIAPAGHSLGQPVIITAGGRAPTIDWLQRLYPGAPVWCADGGVDICRQAERRPTGVIGDGDSASPAAWDWAQTAGCFRQEHPQDKDWTDLQLVLQAVGARYVQPLVVLTGGWGGRFDHAFSNVMSLLWARAWGIRDVVMADEQEILYLLPAATTVEVTCRQRPQSVSLLPLSARCDGVSIDGVRWPLRAVGLRQEKPNALCNRLAKQQDALTVRCERGCLGLYLSWDAGDGLPF